MARILGMNPGRLFKFVHPFNRPNLFYEVRSGLERSYPADSKGKGNECDCLDVGPVPFVHGRNRADG